jgi:DNA-directed RNA polymerase subunit RPC12/RpoP
MIKSVLIVKTHYKCVLCSRLFDLSEKLTGINWCERKILQQSVCGSVLNIQLKQGETKIVNFGTGVQEGCSLLQILLNIYSEYLTKEALGGFGDFQIGQVINALR